MLIQLKHGEPIRFGADNEFGVISNSQGKAEIVKVDEVGEPALVIHDENNENPSLAFSISRIASGPYEPTPVGVFRQVQRPEYSSVVNQQIEVAREQRGSGDLNDLLASQPTWEVG